MTLNYKDLTKEVERIYPKAAKYMRGDAKKLRSFTSDDVSGLSEAFIWLQTPQGVNYWSNIARQLRKRGEIRLVLFEVNPQGDTP